MEELIKNKKELEEDYREHDLLNRDEKIIDYLTRKLDNIQNSSIVWLVWPFWCGKTTFIKQVIEHDEMDKSTKWLNFDARKYPERKDLWENFILDMAKYLWEEWERKVINEFRWKSINIFDASIKDWISCITGFIPHIRDYIFDREKRELEVVEELLKEIFIAIHVWEDWNPISTIYIVIEDIDRSWDSWVYFLQTLNFFLKKINLWKWLKVVALATIGNVEYRGSLDSYLKCIDYVHNFPVVQYNYRPMIDYFLSNECYNSSTIDFINYIWSHFEWFTPRTLKHILRDLLLIFQELEIDEYTESLLDKSSIIIWMLTAKYTNLKWENLTYLDNWKYNWWVIDADIFKSFFLSICIHRPLFKDDIVTESGLLNPDKFNWFDIRYCFYDFRDDDRLICITWATDDIYRTVYIDKKLFSV